MTTTLETEPQGETEVDAGHYQSIVSSLSYAATATHPNIAFAVSALSRYSSRAFTSHLTAAKRVLRYLKSRREAMSSKSTTDQSCGNPTSSRW